MNKWLKIAAINNKPTYDIQTFLINVQRVSCIQCGPLGTDYKVHNKKKKFIYLFTSQLQLFNVISIDISNQNKSMDKFRLNDTENSVFSILSFL